MIFIMHVYEKIYPILYHAKKILIFANKDFIYKILKIIRILVSIINNILKLVRTVLR